MFMVVVDCYSTYWALISNAIVSLHIHETVLKLDSGRGYVNGKATIVGVATSMDGPVGY